MNLNEWTQTISAVGTAIAAISSMIVTLQNRSANKKIDHERHMMVKPFYKIISTFENRLDKNIEFNVVNLGFNRLMNDINVEWKGTDGVKVSIREKIKKEGDNHDCTIFLGFSDCDPSIKEIKGKLILSYMDVLGKIYNESVDIVILYKYYELTKEYSPELQGSMSGKAFC